MALKDLEGLYEELSQESQPQLLQYQPLKETIRAEVRHTEECQERAIRRIFSPASATSEKGSSETSLITINLSDLGSGDDLPAAWLPKHLQQARDHSKSKASVASSSLTVGCGGAAAASAKTKRKKFDLFEPTGEGSLHPRPDPTVRSSADNSGESRDLHLPADKENRYTTFTSQRKIQVPYHLQPVALEDGSCGHESEKSSLSSLPPGEKPSGSDPSMPEDKAEGAYKKQDIDKLLPLIPRDEEGLLTSAGSQHHMSGQCIPCGFVFSKQGCQQGVLCEWCHFKHPRKQRLPRSSHARSALGLPTSAYPKGPVSVPDLAQVLQTSAAYLEGQARIKYSRNGSSGTTRRLVLSL